MSGKSIYQLRMFIENRLPDGYTVKRDKDLAGAWYIHNKPKGREVGDIFYDYDNGLKVSLTDEQVTKELKTLVLLHDLQDRIFIKHRDESTYVHPRRG